MFSKGITTAALMGALALAPADRAEADAGDFVGGALVGGIIGHAIANDQKRKRTTVVRRSYSPSIPVTEHGRQTQTALNYFGFNAGAVDGQIGNGTRRAIERYQASMGYPVNGRDFQPYQYDTLMQAYYWGINGGQMQTGLAGQPLLIAYRQSLMAPPQGYAGQQPVYTGQPMPHQPMAPQMQPQVVHGQPQMMTPPPGYVLVPQGTVQGQQQMVVQPQQGYVLQPAPQQQGTMVAAPQAAPQTTQPAAITPVPIPAMEADKGLLTVAPADGQIMTLQAITPTQ